MLSNQPPDTPLTLSGFPALLVGPETSLTILHRSHDAHNPDGTVRDPRFFSPSYITETGHNTEVDASTYDTPWAPAIPAQRQRQPCMNDSPTVTLPSPLTWKTCEYLHYASDTPCSYWTPAAMGPDTPPATSATGTTGTPATTSHNSSPRWHMRLDSTASSPNPACARMTTSTSSGSTAYTKNILTSWNPGPPWRSTTS